MGKQFSAKPLPAAKKPSGPMSLMGWLALGAAILMLVAVVVLVYLNYVRPQRELPAAPAMQLPDLPAGPELPAKKVLDTPGSALPQVKIEAPPSTPLTEGPPEPPKPEKKEPSGTVTWWWQLYRIPLSMVVTVQMAGYQTVAMGITVKNDSTENVEVSNEHNQFSVNADNKIYTSEIWSTASAVFGGLPYMVPTTLAPQGTIGGYTVFMIPERFSQVTANWQANVPRTVKVVRIDPKVAVIQGNSTPTPTPTVPLPNLDDEK